MLKPVRRIVTGHDTLNRSVIVSDGMPERVQSFSRNGPTYYEIWNTQQSPAMIDRASGEPKELQLTLPPPVGGTRIRILDILPEGREIEHPPMHRTESIDYCLVLQGEITLILEACETVVRTGDIVIQRGTDHAWANRSGRLCRVAFVLVDGEFEPLLGSL